MPFLPQPFSDWQSVLMISNKSVFSNKHVTAPPYLQRLQGCPIIFLATDCTAEFWPNYNQTHLPLTNDPKFVALGVFKFSWRWISQDSWLPGVGLDITESKTFCSIHALDTCIRNGNPSWISKFKAVSKIAPYTYLTAQPLVVIWICQVLPTLSTTG